MPTPLDDARRIYADAERMKKRILQRRDVNNPFFQYWNGRANAAQDIIRSAEKDK